jgi:cytochrome c6
MKTAMAVLMTASVCLWIATVAAGDGQALFARHCAGCHYQGGNSVNPAKPLTKMYREANGQRTTADLVAKMRRGGPGMPRFSTKELPEAEARAIAEHIKVTFN